LFVFELTEDSVHAVEFVLVSVLWSLTRVVGFWGIAGISLEEALVAIEGAGHSVIPALDLDGFIDVGLHARHQL
jgi:hypothetical protein